jgi:hypothetical protein
MGHDEHFLRRLDRVSDHHVELSLTLYRDQDLLRDVLARAALPEGVERLAISLDDPREGPFVIVTREGRFVTCLAKGMLIDRALVVLPRARLDAAIAKVERMRERMALVETLRSQRAEGIAGRLFRRMREDGLHFCREDAETLLQVWPLVGAEAVHIYNDTVNYILEHRERVAALRIHRLRAHEREYIRTFGNAAWLTAHLVVLTTEPESREVFSRVQQRSNADLAMLNAEPVFMLGSYAHAMRVLWSLARRPNPVASLRSLRDTQTYELIVMREMGLGVVALRSSKHRAEALKEMERAEMTRVPSDLPPRETMKHHLRNMAAAIALRARISVEGDEIVRKEHIAVGRETAAMIIHPGQAVTDAMREAISDQVAGACFPNISSSWLPTDTIDDNMLRLAISLPWLARAEPADLFLPRSYTEQIGPMEDQEVENMMKLFAKARALGLPAPVKAAATPGRNEACSCGSGKKYKRCCG